MFGEATSQSRPGGTTSSSSSAVAAMMTCVVSLMCIVLCGWVRLKVNLVPACVVQVIILGACQHSANSSLHIQVSGAAVVPSVLCFSPVF